MASLGWGSDVGQRQPSLVLGSGLLGRSYKVICSLLLPLPSSEAWGKTTMQAEAGWHLGEICVLGEKSTARVEELMEEAQVGQASWVGSRLRETPGLGKSVSQVNGEKRSLHLSEPG